MKIHSLAVTALFFLLNAEGTVLVAETYLHAPRTSGSRTFSADRLDQDSSRNRTENSSLFNYERTWELTYKTVSGGTTTALFGIPKGASCLGSQFVATRIQQGPDHAFAHFTWDEAVTWPGYDDVVVYLTTVGTGQGDNEILWANFWGIGKPSAPDEITGSIMYEHCIDGICQQSEEPATLRAYGEAPDIEMYSGVQTTVGETIVRDSVPYQLYNGGLALKSTAAFDRERNLVTTCEKDTPSSTRFYYGSQENRGFQYRNEDLDQDKYINVKRQSWSVSDGPFHFQWYGTTATTESLWLDFTAM